MAGVLARGPHRRIYAIVYRLLSWGNGCVMVATAALLLFGFLWGLDGVSFSRPGAAGPGLLAAWALRAWVLGLIGHRGWRARQQRPHPFLPISRGI